MLNHQELLKDFPKSREEKLRSIKRYSMFDVFYYRSTLWHHSLRVFFLIDEFFKAFQNDLPGFDWNKARALALVHDDAEMITGDIQLGHKQHMTPEQLKALADNEALAIEELANGYPKEIAGYNYQELLLNILHKDIIEAQLVSYADKSDAYCESLHEVFGGNISGLRAVINYVGVLRAFKEQYPNLKPIFKNKTSFLSTTDFYTDPWQVHKENYVYLGQPHKPETIRNQTQFILYNTWKNLVLDNLGTEGMEILTNQRESLK